MDLTDETLAPHLPTLRRWALRQHTFDPAVEADDLVQQAITELLAADRRGDAPALPLASDLLNFLGRRMTNRAIDCRKRLAHRLARGIVVLPLHPEHAVDTPEGSFTVTLDAPDPRADLEADYLLSEALDAALAALAGDFRAAIVVLDGLDYTYDEIAARLGIRRGTVASRLNRYHAKRKEHAA